MQPDLSPSYTHTHTNSFRSVYSRVQICSSWGNRMPLPRQHMPSLLFKKKKSKWKHHQERWNPTPPSLLHLSGQRLGWRVGGGGLGWLVNTFLFEIPTAHIIRYNIDYVYEALVGATSDKSILYIDVTWNSPSAVHTWCLDNISFEVYFSIFVSLSWRLGYSFSIRVGIDVMKSMRK